MLLYAGRHVPDSHHIAQGPGIAVEPSTVHYSSVLVPASKKRVGSRSSATHGWMPLQSPMGRPVYPFNGLPVGPLVHGAWDEACDGMVTSTTTPLDGLLIYLAWDLKMLGGRRANGYRIVGVHNGYLACSHLPVGRRRLSVPAAWITMVGSWPSG